MEWYRRSIFACLSTAVCDVYHQTWSISSTLTWEMHLHLGIFPGLKHHTIPLHFEICS